MAIQNAEVWTEDKVIQELKNVFGENCIYRREDSQLINESFKTALQRQIPEAIVVDSITNAPYLLFEAKGAKQTFEKAKSETIEYLQNLYKNGFRIPFGLAVKESSICLFYQKNNGEIIECLNQNNDLVNFIPSKTEFDNLLKNEGVIVIGSHDELSGTELQDFCNNVNIILHNNGITENERAKVFTAFLIALLDKEFRTNFLDEKNRNTAVEKRKSDMEKVYDHVSNTIRKIIEDIEDTKKITISNKIKALETNEGKAIWVLTGNLISQSNLNDFIVKLFNSVYLLGDIYETFYTYTGKNSMGQYFTPRHVVEMMVNLTEKIRGSYIDYRKDIVYDPACGVGGFLVSAFKKSINNARLDEQELAKEIMGLNGLFGVEYAPDVASIAKINLLLRGDGKTGIIEGDSLNDNIISKLDKFEKERKQQLEENKLLIDRKIRPTITLMNPPFPAKADDPKAYEFILHAIDISSEGAYISALIPTSCILKSGKESSGKINETQFRKKALENCQLKAVITLPQDLFYPKASINTSIVILEKTGKPHKTTEDIVFARCNNDGYKPNKSTGIRTLEENKKTTNDLYLLLHKWLPEYTSNTKYDLPLKFINGRLLPDEVKNGSEWTPEPRITGKTLYEEVISNYKEIYSQLLGTAIFKQIQNNSLDFNSFKNRTNTINASKIDKLNKTLVKIFKKSDVRISDLFKYENGKFKGDLELLEKNGDVAIVSASEFNNGILGYTDVLSCQNIKQYGISVAKNGKPCVCRVQTEDKCVLTTDVLWIEPKIKINERNLLLLASVLEQKQWRFSYGRKLTWDRFKDLKIFE